MGYLSDVRIVMKKEDYKEFIEKAKENLKVIVGKEKIEEILNDNIIDDIDILKEINNEYYQHQVYFGWNGVKWDETYYEVRAINQALAELFEKENKGFIFCRCGEDYEDYEEIDNSINYDLYYPQLVRYFDDDNIQ